MRFGLYSCQLGDFFLSIHFYLHFYHNCIFSIQKIYKPLFHWRYRISELQSESDARSITTGSCSSSTALSFAQYVRSTDLTWSTHLAHSPGVIALKPSCCRCNQYSHAEPFVCCSALARFFCQSRGCCQSSAERPCRT